MLRMSVSVAVGVLHALPSAAAANSTVTADDPSDAFVYTDPANGADNVRVIAAQTISEDPAPPGKRKPGRCS